MPRFFALALALAVSAFAQGDPQQQTERRYYSYVAPAGNAPGCAFATEEPGSQPVLKVIGVADLEHNVPITPDTVFEAGSVSKQFTAAAVLLLAERGRFSLDDPIAAFFPELPDFEKRITIRQMLNHTSGLRDWGEVVAIAGWPRTTREHTHAHVLDVLSRQCALNYPPGEAWSYTNSGYNLAAILVERVTGMSLQEFCKKEFFVPLGMNSTQWRDDFRRIVPNRAIAYSKRGDEWRQDMPFEDIYGNGGLLTTVGDLQKWNRNLAHPTLHPQLFALMQQPGRLNNGQPIGYGLGLFLQNFDGIAEVSHSGATAGYRAWLGRFPASGLSIAILCNGGSYNPTEFAHKTARAVLDLPTPAHNGPLANAQAGLYCSLRDHATLNIELKDGVPVMKGRPFPVGSRFDGIQLIIPDATAGPEIWEQVEAWTPADLAPFTGTYTSDEAETTFRVTSENGKLVIHRRPDSSFPLTPTYRDAFGSSLGAVRFVRDSAGQIVSLDISNARVWDLPFRRQP